MDVHWQLQDAKQQFSAVVRRARTDGPQFVTRHGKDVAVIVDIDEYHRLIAREDDELKDYLLDRVAVADLEIHRSRETGRRLDLSV